ncbi:Penicillin-binding protein 2D [Hartmannibacter diazotrophicus]|uniref:Penicillin-binding protein 2D n=1 Tax=Hartmannibacter diazotrophicus TaxID=1482074 RepID=A0A2C9DDQ3_9HYPH|nr:penicillin-binding protein 1A [Hartmannibacter diazotrophicus]SON58289.1 Penicillin-binding protein 2D [Hartmannibacter diazotrophicus]
MQGTRTRRAKSGAAGRQDERREPHFGPPSSPGSGSRASSAKSRPKTRAGGGKGAGGNGGDKGGSGKGGGGRARRAAPKRRFTLAGFFRRLVYWGCVLGLWGGIALVGILAYFAAHLPQSTEWAIPKRPPNVQIYDASGELFANRGDTGGQAVRLEQLPPYLPEAVIAIEDRRFYHHFGVDPIGLVRAVITNVAAGSVVQGGSTLTQQLAKNLFLTPDRTIDRKMQEVVLALWLEWTYSKDEILEMYLNRVYLGAGAYGVDAAARRYFGKPAVELELGEAATIAGLLRAPSRYAPTRNPELARDRARTVLDAMAEEGYITRSQEMVALDNPAKVASEHATRAENYVADWVMDQLPGYVGALDGDVRVETTIDSAAERAAEAAIRKIIADEGTKAGITQGALVALDDNGAVRALVGGRDYASSQFDRAISARRQPGSAFKPFVYVTALEHGYRPDSIIVDEPVSIRGWRPENYGKGYRGPISLTTALADSVNTVAARLTASLGPSNVTRTARRMGVLSKMHDNPSIALGTAEVTPLEITSAYVPFANGGKGVIPYVIERIVDAKGKVLFQRNGSGPGRVLSDRILGDINRMMSAVVERGTGKAAALPGRAVGGKTGTSQDFRDAWFIGYTPGLTAGVWLGNDNSSPTRHATGGDLPARIWASFMREAVAGLPARPLPGTPTPAPDMTVAAAPPSSPAAGGPTEAERGLLERLFSD